MKKIELQSLEELKAGEDLPEIPELVQEYLGLKKEVNQGDSFRILINKKSNPVSGHGIAYSNELQIENKDGDNWKKAYGTGMMEYRGAYASDIDNWDLSLNSPAILNESEDGIIYALRTGKGNIKVYRFQKNLPEIVDSFNINDYEKTKKRIELLQEILNEAETFRSYVVKGLGSRWHTASKISKYDDDCQIFEDGKVVILLAKHSDRDYDPIVDCYQIYVWVQGQGFGSSDVFQTDLHHPGGRFYIVTIRFEATIINQGKGYLNLEVEAKNRSQDWSKKNTFHVEWKVEKSPFETKVELAMEDVIKSHQHIHPLYKPTQITESIVDSEKGIAAWILFEQIDTDRNTEYGEGWLGDQFRYSLWKLWKMGDNGNDPVQIYEDHAYIRQHSKSGLTGTQGRDCTLKNLRIENGQIKVSHPRGERVEDQEWEELIF
jgi:hypothetical protein